MSDPVIAEAMAKLRALIEKPQPPRPPRFSRQVLLEDEIAMFRPDYCEAVELLDALEHGLEFRMNDFVHEEVSWAFAKLRKALQNADADTSQLSEEDRAYAQWQATQEEPYEPK